MEWKLVINNVTVYQGSRLTILIVNLQRLVEAGNAVEIWRRDELKSLMWQYEDGIIWN